MEGGTTADNMPSGSMVKRFKFLWRVFLLFNFGLGAYMFAQAGKKERVKEKIETPTEVASVPAAETAPSQEEPVISPIVRPVIPRPPLPEEQQRELFKWMLEEKRKARPRGQEEKKRIDEEKAILKEFIRSNSIPSI